MIKTCKTQERPSELRLRDDSVVTYLSLWHLKAVGRMCGFSLVDNHKEISVFGGQTCSHGSHCNNVQLPDSQVNLSTSNLLTQ